MQLFSDNCRTVPFLWQCKPLTECFWETQCYCLHHGCNIRMDIAKLKLKRDKADMDSRAGTRGRCCGQGADAACMLQSSKNVTSWRSWARLFRTYSPHSRVVDLQDAPALSIAHVQGSQLRCAYAWYSIYSAIIKQM